MICHHTGNLILDCLKCLEESKSDIYVVTSQQRLFQPPVKTIFTTRNEPTFKRNLATFGYVYSKYVAFLDDDVAVLPEVIEGMAHYLEDNPKVGMVYGTLYNRERQDEIDSAGSYMSWCGFLYEDYNIPKEPFKILSGKSALCMVRTSVFKSLGGFDTDYVIYGEETDLSWRIWNMGLEVIQLPGAVGLHAHDTKIKTPEYYNKQYIHYNGCKNYIMTLIKNAPLCKFYLVIFNTLIWIFMAVAFLFKRKQVSRWIMQGIFWNITHFRNNVKKRTGNYQVKEGQYKNAPFFYYLNRFKGYLTHQIHAGVRN